ncbi:MAG: efflux RND transporter permease subunit [candidate division KSB1 bacterium]|nr:efflux RND transporter permease subunit [candidate division KSB1 bacterium]MDZ7303025.1 efflux RND transporter permease subunit [candidate division KSB1 bacterium]MDZ7312467.1 efflux RND transporter permease subunit [candidate division KSB1 bacterium]
MKITQTAIKRGVTFAMIYLIAVGFGLFSLGRLDIDLYPKLEFPVIALISQYTGVGPFDMETVVTRPVEEVVASVQNIEKITSTSAQGLSLVMLEFDWGTDMNQAEIDVRNSLEFIQDVLPQEVNGPLVFAFDPSQQPIFYLALSSDMHGMAELRRIAERDLEPRLERIPGVASAFTMGGMRREIKVLVDPARLRAHNIPIEQVSAALQMGNLQLPAGKIDNAMQEFTIQTAGEYSNLEQIENTSVAAMNGSVIRVKDVASVVDGFVEQQQQVWNNGKPAVMVVIQKQSDANTAQVCKEVRTRFAQIEAELPKGVRLETVIDFSEFINRSMANLGNTALQAIALTFLVLLFFLRNLRSSLIVAVSIPVSMIVTFAVMDQAGLTLNIISMAGLALAVGMLVDNSIVVLENIFRHREMGEELREASHNGATEVSMAITASTLTTLAVFVPVLFVPGLAGELFNDMVVTICFSLTVSLLVALTLIPLLSSRLLHLREKLHQQRWLAKTNDTIGGWLTSLYKTYAVGLKWSLAHRKTVVLSALGLFILSIIILASLGGEFLPQSDSGFVAIAVDRAPGTSLEAMETSMREIDSIIRESVPEAKNTYINFGQGESIMAFFSSRTSSEGDVTIGLTKLTERKRTQFDIQDDLRERLKTIPGVEVRFADRGQEAMFGGGSDIQVEIFGHDLSRAEALANVIAEKVKNIKGVADVETSLRESAPELRINFDRQRLADLGLSTAQLSRLISTSVLGSVVTRYREAGDEYDVRVQLIKEARKSKEDIENILIVTPAGKPIPLRAVAEVEYSKAPVEITREGQERMVSVNIDISGRDLRSVTKDVRKALRQVSVPNDFRIEIGGVAEEQQESFMYLGLAMLAALVLVYMVMASQFESLLDPFIILFTIPLSSIGVALALFLTGTNLNVMALIGIIMLVGIVVNNGIVLVDFINQLRNRGKELFEAIMEAGRARMRPVLMTALTTILAMLPLALGLGESGENWAPMARAVMGGLTAAMVLTLLVVPVIYAMVELKAEKIRQKREARRVKDQSELTPARA